MRSEQEREKDSQDYEQSKKDFKKEAKNFGEKLNEYRNSSHSDPASNASKYGQPVKGTGGSENLQSLGQPIGNPATTGSPTATTTGAATGNTVGTTLGGTTAGTATGTAAGTVTGAATGTAAGTTAGAATGAAAGATAGATAGGMAAATPLVVASGPAAPIVAGVLLGIAALKMVHNKIKMEANSLWDTADPEKDSGKLGMWFISFYFVICICMCLLASPAAILATRIYQETNEVRVWIISYSEKAQFFKELFDAEEYDVELDALVNSQQGVDANNVTIYEAIIDKAIDFAFRDHIKSVLLNPTTFLQEFFSLFTGGYGPLEQLQAFFDAPYPYSLAKENGEFYTVLDYINGDIPKDELNNDLNYAEIICVVCQRTDSNYYNISYSDFYDILVDNDNNNTKVKLFELEFESEAIHYYIDDDTGEKVIIEDVEAYMEATRQEYARYMGNSSSSDSSDDADSSPAYTLDDYMVSQGYGYYYPIHLMPYGLQELYDIADVDPYEYNDTFTTMYNYDVLDYNEEWLRGYLEKAVYLGPAYDEPRGQSSITYNLYQDTGVEATGRSAYKWLYNSITTADMADNYYDYEPTDRPDISVGYIKTGETVILDIAENWYINQGWYPNSKRGNSSGDTIKQSGCIDCSYVMAAQYFHQAFIDIEAVCATSSYYSGAAFRTQAFCADNNMSTTGAIAFNAETIRQQLTQGNPVLFHLSGVWSYNGTTYHNSASGHFLLIIGYDDNGFFLCDPGSKANTIRTTSVPIAAFNRADDAHIRFITYNNGSFIPDYKVNTIINGETQ